MGMGYGANFAEIVEQADVERICPAEFKALMVELAQQNATLEEFAVYACYEAEDEFVGAEHLIPAYGLLCQLEETFKQATNGLELYFGYHDQDNEGDRYDDVSGVYWSITNAYEMTDAAKAFGGTDKIKRQFFVTFG